MEMLTSRVSIDKGFVGRLTELVVVVRWTYKFNGGGGLLGV